MWYTKKQLEAIEQEEPLLQPEGLPTPLQHPKRRPMSNLNLRIPGEELVRLSREAQKLGMNPTQLARRLITEGLDRLDGFADLPSRVQRLEAEIAKFGASLHG